MVDGSLLVVHSSLFMVTGGDSVGEGAAYVVVAELFSAFEVGKFGQERYGDDSAARMTK